MSRSPLPFALLSFLVACAQESAAPTCVDDACPEGMVCSAAEGVCHEEPVTPYTPGVIGSRNSLAVDADGRLVVSTFDRERSALVVGRGTSRADLEFVLVDAADDAPGTSGPNEPGAYTASAFDGEGLLHVLYYVAGKPGISGTLRHGVLDGLRLVRVELADSGGDVGSYPTLVAAGSTLHGAWHDATHGALRYGRRGPAGWEVVSVPSPAPLPCATTPCAAASPGRFPSIGLAGGLPVIAHYEATRGDLLLSTLGPAGWATARLDGVDPATGGDTADVGRYASLAVSPGGTVGIAYHDATNGALRYTYSEDGVQKVLIVDDGVSEDPDTGVLHRSVVGQHARLLLSPTGAATVWYLDATAMVLRRAERAEDGSWSASEAAGGVRGGPWIAAATLTDGGTAVAWEAIALDGAGSAVSRDLAIWVGP